MREKIGFGVRFFVDYAGIAAVRTHEMRRKFVKGRSGRYVHFFAPEGRVVDIPTDLTLHLGLRSDPVSRVL